MRHRQPLVGGERVEPGQRRPRPVDRGQSQPLELRHLAKKSFHQQAEARRVAGDVDAGQHDLAMAALDQEARLRDHIGNRHRSRSAAAEQDDAEGAAVSPPTAILDLQERAGVAGDILEPMKRGLAGRRPVVADRDFSSADQCRRRTASGRCRARDRPRASRRTCWDRFVRRSRSPRSSHRVVRGELFGSLGAPASPPRRSPRGC